MKEEKLKLLAKKPANELNARELNLVRRYQSYVRKLKLEKEKEHVILAAFTKAQKRKERSAARQSVLLEKIAAVEEESNAKTREPEPEPIKETKAEPKPKLKAVG